MKKAWLITATLVFALSGCTTVDDFKKMSAYERAEMVCNNANELKTIQDLLYKLNLAAAHLTQNITRGYALHRQCIDQQVPDTTYGTISPNYGSFGGGYTYTGHTHTRTVTTCHDVPVAINVYAEQEKLDNLNNLRASGLKELNEKKQACFNAVMDLPAEDAFRYYDMGGLPLKY